jgi:preprotein translocase subunit YajC
MKILLTIAFFAIAVSLCFAFFYMVRPQRDVKTSNKQMANALTFRIGISVALFCCVLIAWSLGWIQPTGIIGR